MYWEIVKTPSGGFRIRKEWTNKPAIPIKDIFANGSKYAFECATAMVIVYYKAVLDTFGEQKFNKVFGKGLLLYDWYEDKDKKNYPLWYVPGFTGQKEVPDYFPGDLRYFKNPEVHPAFMQWQGENTIDLGDGKYYGHPFGETTAQGIINGLNTWRKPGATMSAYLMKKASRPDFVALFAKKVGCFIASAAYGSELASEVQFLRQFRDNTLKQSVIGSSALNIFENFYYRFAPFLARKITPSETLRGLTRFFVADPIVKLLSFFVYIFSSVVRSQFNRYIHNQYSSIIMPLLIISNGIGSLLYCGGWIAWNVFLVAAIVDLSMFHYALLCWTTMILGLLLMQVGKGLFENA